MFICLKCENCSKTVIGVVDWKEPVDTSFLMVVDIVVVIGIVGVVSFDNVVKLSVVGDLVVIVVDF